MYNLFFTKHLPLAVKNAFFYLFLIVFSSFFIGYTIYRLSAKMIVSSSKDKIKNEVESISLKMTAQFEHVARDIRFLSINPLVEDYIHTTADQKDFHYARLGEEFKALLYSKPAYFQVRLIGVADGGRELVRADRTNDGVVLAPRQKLQQKGDRNYFEEASRLTQGSIYFSEIDLNREFGSLQIPYIPTLRVACPIYSDRALYGIVIINMNLQNLFNDLKKTVSAEEVMYVFNNAGYFLIHPDEKECFGFEFGRPPNAYYWFPDLTRVDPAFKRKVAPDSLLISEKYVTEFFTLLHPRTDYKLFVAISTPERYILYPFVSWRKKTFWLTLFITLGFLAIAFLWMRRQSKELKKITRSMVQFSKDHKESRLVVNNTDEIGDLASAFSSMASTISKNVQELESSREIAVKANLSKEEFLENMSHEIRNPLQSILGMTNILEQNLPRPDQQSAIRTIQFSSKQLLSLVNDILDFSKIKIGQITLHPEEINLSRLIKDIISSHLFLSKSKHLILDYDLEAGLEDIFVFLDPLRLSQILNNLIINAIKFSPAGGRIVLELHSVRQEDEVMLDFEVIDQGDGIPLEELDKIQKRHYTQGATDLNSNLSGAGLGLPIIIQLLHLFDSELKVESTQGIGSKFSFRLVSKYIYATQQQDVTHAPLNTLPPAINSILCIDDDPQIIYFYKQVFNKQGTQLICVQNKAELEVLQGSASFDLIVADYMLPDMPVDQLLPILAKLRSTHTLLILLSGIETQMVKDQLEDMAIDAFIQKPVSSAILFSRIMEAWMFKNQSPPFMEEFYADYDHRKDLIQNALHILIEEWREMGVQLSKSLYNKDQQTFEQVFHKIITTIRRFKLFAINDLLNEMNGLMQIDSPIDVSSISRLNHLMQQVESYFVHQLDELKDSIIKY
ncbi:MAG: ATP-binding protein [Saprospiraceae bacterium]